MTTVPTVAEVARAVRNGDVTVRAIVEAALASIEATTPALNTFHTVATEAALERADALDRDPSTRSLPLAGVPIAVKDNISTKGLKTTAGSRVLECYVPPYDAAVIERLTAAGAVVVGKTNCDEFAMGSSTENSAFGPTRNPWASDRSPGGSSGGSAAAVAVRSVSAALGSDTGGSIRQPAALCGVVGLKPTYGRVSRFGLIAFGSSLDQIGPLTTTVEDAALMLGAIAGHDARDATSAREPIIGFANALRGDIRDLRLGVPRTLLNDGVDAEVLRAFDQALDVLGQLGATIVDVTLPHASFAVPVYYLVATAEASSNLARYDGVRYGFRAPSTASTGDSLDAMYRRTRDQGFGAEVKRRIMLGTYVLSHGYYDAYYLKSQQMRTLIRRDYEHALRETDAVLMPTSPTPAFRLGERVDDPLQMYLLDVFTVSANLAGLPAISVPCGFTTTGLPVGLQLTGRAFDEATLLRIGDAYERQAGWSARQPSPTPPR